MANDLRASNNGGRLSNAAGMALGAGAAALVPLAIKGVSQLARNAGGDDEDRDNEAPGTGEGRRLPVQQSVDIGAPPETVYGQWTQFEEWPTFMHRVTRVTQEDDRTVSVEVKIWGQTKEFKAEIDTQRPDEIIRWHTSEGMKHTGVVTFHELAPRLTRVLINFDVEPGGWLEKAARNLRYVKRAARADLHRFKAFVEMQEEASGRWGGTIEKGEVVRKRESRTRGRANGSARSRPASSQAASSRSQGRPRRGSGNGKRSSGDGHSARSRGRES
jgi:uncharacterized membrane protein